MCENCNFATALDQPLSISLTAEERARPMDSGVRELRWCSSSNLFTAGLEYVTDILGCTDAKQYDSFFIEIDVREHPVLHEGMQYWEEMGLGTTVWRAKVTPKSWWLSSNLKNRKKYCHFMFCSECELEAPGQLHFQKPFTNVTKAKW